MCLSLIWTEKHEMAKRLAQQIKTVLDVAVEGAALRREPCDRDQGRWCAPQNQSASGACKAMHWKDVPGFYAALSTKSAMAAQPLMFTCVTGARIGEVLGLRWAEMDWEAGIWIYPPEWMKTGEVHRVPLTEAMIGILKPLRALRSDFVFEGQKRHQPLSNLSMLRLLRRMKIDGVTVHGFRSTFRDCAAEVANAAFAASARVSSVAKKADIQNGLKSRISPHGLKAAPSQIDQCCTLDERQL